VKSTPRDDECGKASTLTKVEEGPKTLRNDGRVSTYLVPWKYFIAWKLENSGRSKAPPSTQEKSQIRSELLGRVIVRSDTEEGSRRLLS
jgi:hypothetical protein